MQNDNAASSCLTTNQHSLPMPGMPRVGDLSKIGFMGVEYLGCTKEGIRIKVSLTHEEIAQLIGTSRETVTRVLSEFRDKKLARLRGSTLMILDKPGMERLIET